MTDPEQSAELRTMAAYEAHATAYADAARDSTHRIVEVEDFAARLPAGARVLEIGSGPGQDARLLDPSTDELLPPGAQPYDGVWSSACLLHVRREGLQPVLARLRGAVGARGWLYLSLKEGDGESWSEHGTVAAPRFYSYWREGPLRQVLVGAGWRVEELRRRSGERDSWLCVVARAG